MPSTNTGIVAIMRGCPRPRLNYLEEISHAIHSPLASDIVSKIREAYANALPGLPYTELPVFAISGKLSVRTFDLRSGSEMWICCSVSFVFPHADTCKVKAVTVPFCRTWWPS